MEDNIFSDEYIGTVLKIDKTSRKLGVYIPKLMSSMDGGEALEYNIPTNSGLNIDDTSTNISSTVKKINYIWAVPYDYDYQLPEIGSKVKVAFIDSNPNFAYWEKFNINNDYKIIEEERYPKLYNLKIGDKEFNVNTNDNIKINLPKYFEVTQSISDNHNIELNVNEKYNFYFDYSLEESITKLQKSIEFLENEYESTFISTISNITPIFNGTETSNILQNYFRTYQNDSIDKIQKSVDLSDSNNYFKYYSKLLNGLSKTYSNYLIYLDKYTQFAHKELIPNITEKNINNQIINMFKKAMELSNTLNIDDYTDYIVSVFDPKVYLEFNYLDNNRVSHKLQPNTPEDIFELIKTDINTAPELAKLSEASPLISINNYEKYILESNFYLQSWSDENDNILYSRNAKSENFIINDSYYAVYNTKVFPKFYGIMLIKELDNTIQLSMYNKTKLIQKPTSHAGSDGLTTKISYNNSSGKTENLTFYNIIDANNKLKEISENKLELLSLNSTCAFFAQAEPSVTYPSVTINIKK